MTNSKQYFQCCQYLDENGNCCKEVIFKKIKIFGDSKLYNNRWFEVCLCKKHYKDINNE